MIKTKYIYIGIGIMIVLLVMIATVVILSGLTENKEKSIELKEGEWSKTKLKPGDGMKVTYEVNVTDSEEVDVYIMTETSYENYLKGREFGYKSDASRQGVNHCRYQGVLSGEVYYFVIDNTDAGEATPPAGDEVSLEYMLEQATPGLPGFGFIDIMVPALLVNLIYIWLNREKGR